MSPSKSTPSKLQFKGSTAEDLKVGQIANMDGEMYFIFRAIEKDTHEVELKALPIVKSTIMTEDRDRYLDIYPSAATQIGLKSDARTRYVVDLDPVSFPKDKDFPFIILATGTIRDKNTGLFNAVMQSANERFLRKECPDLYKEREEVATPVKSKKPKWQRDLEKHGKVTTPTISIDSAKAAGIMDNITANLLSHGTLPDGSKIGTVHAALLLATSEKKRDQAAFIHLFETAAANSKIRLSTLFNEGYINESEPVDQMKELGVTTLGKAFKLIKDKDPLVDEIWDEDKKHLITCPANTMRLKIKEAEKAFLQTFIVK